MKERLITIPACIDPHVHFRIPGKGESEDWIYGAKAAFMGGVTHVFDMPNNDPPCITEKAFWEKKKEIDAQLKKAEFPLKYGLYFGAAKGNVSEIEKVATEIAGIKIFMGSSTGTLLVDDDPTLESIFQVAKRHDLLIAVHAEDEKRIQKRKAKFTGSDPALHSLVRDEEAARIACLRAIAFAKKYGVRLYLLHISTKEELAVIEDAKKEMPNLYAEATPHHLFFDDSAYEILGTKALVNPPLRRKEHQEALWEAILKGVIDTIGTDHAPHLLSEKEKPYGFAPSGMPGISTYLPLLFNAHNEGKISMEKIISLTSEKPRELLRLDKTKDELIIDLALTKTVEKIPSKCSWTPYAGRVLQGWPVALKIENKLYSLYQDRVNSSEKNKALL